MLLHPEEVTRRGYENEQYNSSMENIHQRQHNIEMYDALRHQRRLDKNVVKTTASFLSFVLVEKSAAGTGITN